MKPALSFALVCSFCLPVGAFAQEEPATGEGTSSSFLDGLEWQVMASGFYLFNAHRVSGPYNDLGYPYTNYKGFGLNAQPANVRAASTTAALKLDGLVIAQSPGSMALTTKASSALQALRDILPSMPFSQSVRQRVSLRQSVHRSERSSTS